ncbi:hypothetical protein JKF63_07275 [Porcisia hertigi]|uniref:Uncharacterized protein n=1 Tax=Porcisia hertigi TaxID=2761500 RepID=A0A836LLC2_9TRYP|nr:hypothetical protein JKF63_07275 [Porcisia hertigi]
MDFAASESGHGPASQSDSSSSYRCTRADKSRYGNTQPSAHRPGSREYNRYRNHHHHHNNNSQPEENENSSRRHRHRHRTSVNVNDTKAGDEELLRSEVDPPPSSNVDVGRGPDAQEPEKFSLNDTTRSSLVSTQSSRLPIRRHDRLSLTKEHQNQKSLSFSGPLSSVASEAIEVRKAPAARSESSASLLAKYSESINNCRRRVESPAAATPPSPSSSSKASLSLVPSENPLMEKGSSGAPGAPNTMARTGKGREVRTSRTARKVSGDGFASQPWTQPQAAPPSPSSPKASGLPSSPRAATPALMEVDQVKPDARVRVWQKDVDAGSAGIHSPSLTSCADRPSHSAAQRVQPSVTLRPTPSYRTKADVAGATLSSSSACASHASAIAKMALRAPGSCLSGKASSDATKNAAEGSVSLARQQPAAETVATTHQALPARLSTSTAIVEEVHESSFSERPGRGSDSSLSEQVLSSTPQRPRMAELPATETQRSPRHDSGAHPPSPAARSFTSSLSAVDVPPCKPSEQATTQHSSRVAASVRQSSVTNAAAATPNSPHGSSTPRTFQGSRNRTSSSGRCDHPVSVNSSSIASFEPSQLSTARRGTIRRSTACSYVQADPLAEVPTQERQRLLNLPHHVSTTLGTSRLDITFEEDLKELYKQTHLVDPLLRSRPGRRQFHIPEQADLFGMYPEPPMTVDKNGDLILQHLAPIPIKGRSFVPPQNRKSPQPEKRAFTARSLSGDNDHGTSDESAPPPPPEAPASDIQPGKAPGTPVSSRRSGAMAVVRPGRGLASFVFGYGEEATAHERGGLTPRRGRIVSDITALYRRRTATGTGFPSDSRCESLMYSGLPSPCDSETPLPRPAELSSPVMFKGAEVVQALTPFGNGRPASPSQPCSDRTTLDGDCCKQEEVPATHVAGPTTPLQDQKKHGNSARVILGEERESSDGVQPSEENIMVLEPSRAVQAAPAAQPSWSGDAGSDGLSEEISSPAKAAVDQESTPIGSGAEANLDARPSSESTPAAFITAKPADAQRHASTDGFAAAERAPALSLVTATNSLPNESIKVNGGGGGSSNKPNAPRTTSSIAADDSSESERASTRLRRSWATPKRAPVEVPGERPQPPAESEMVAAVALGHAAPRLKTAASATAHTMGSWIRTTSAPCRHTDPQDVAAAKCSPSSLPLLSERTRRYTNLGKTTPTGVTRVSPAESRASVNVSPADAPSPLHTPPRTTPAPTGDVPPQASAADSESNKASTPDADDAVAREQPRFDEVPMARDRDKHSTHRCRQNRDYGAPEGTAQEAPAASAEQGNTPVLSMCTPYLSPCVIGDTPVGLSGGFHRALLVAEDSTQTDFVSNSLEEQQLQYVQQEQLLINLQIMHLQRQQERLLLNMQRIGSKAQGQQLQILNSDGGAPSILTTASMPRVSPSPQAYASESANPAIHLHQRAAGIATGTSRTHRRRNYSANDSRGVRDALRWVN